MRNPGLDSRLNAADALHLLRDAPLLELGAAAFAAKRKRYGDLITYVLNRHINPTNLCVYACRFCDFAAKPGDAHAYQMNESEIIATLGLSDIREVHLVGGLWKTWDFKRSIALVRRIRAARPDLWIKAFTAVEVVYFARTERASIVEILRQMREAGVDMLPGGGAEVLNTRIHRALYPQKASPSEWLAVHETAHRLGIPSNATMLYGHIETDAEIVEHLQQLRDLQDRTGGFASFIPLSYQPGGTQLVPHLVSPVRSLRIIAAARLFLDNIPHIKAYWPSLQLETAAAALSFGADDLDGTLGRERIMQLAGTGSPAQLSARFLERIARDAGQIPVERDGRYQRVSLPFPVSA